jgi:hypothetical protein
MWSKMEAFAIWGRAGAEFPNLVNYQTQLPCRPIVCSTPRGVPLIQPHITITRTYTLGIGKHLHLRTVPRKFSVEYEAADNPFQTNQGSFSQSCSLHRITTVKTILKLMFIARSFACPVLRHVVPTQLSAFERSERVVLSRRTPFSRRNRRWR